MSWRPTRLEVDLEKVRNNYRAIRKHVGESVRIFGVVKGDAYNLGADKIGRVLADMGVDFFAVATGDEAISLRESGIESPILVLGPSPYGIAEEYVRLGIRAAINDKGIAKALSDASVRLQKPAYGHVKIDSGMGRIGFFPHEAADAVEEISHLPGLNLEGIFTHFAISDARDLTYTYEQHSTFVKVIGELEKRGITFSIKHCCNSGATLALPQFVMDGVRPGQLVVGMYPSKEVVRSIAIEPVFEFKTAISAIRTVPAGKKLSYGLTYETTADERIAVIPVGYHDGYSRELSGKGTEVLIHGKRCPIVGRICMDQALVDVSVLQNPQIGDEVVLLGKQGEETITGDEIADKIGTIFTTLPNMIGKRVPRVYLNE
ncbi:MAG: alanine racemase [Aminobacterium colombiense]|jgi:alanine racemase|uniref:Alanine racemase n=1 Tax=Aminobacterium colombiense (strain DSM 12261 / ALA-1) TaxID=572547 RepID=D5ECS6_AMICL|nr:alanine racemase [Aminobacterium colombiense]ADE56358.1 alanine racemase [Aminobacterium colombiense DSM 12261]MDD2379578.1 alanine racemase [Aminobacterium colombiense]MDD4586381.1 alanine racemase [Aminobacterium colombiense]